MEVYTTFLDTCVLGTMMMDMNQPCWDHTLISLKKNWKSCEHGTFHTLISFEDVYLQTFRFLLAELSFLTLIATRSIGFHDVSEGNKPKKKKLKIGVNWSI